MSARVEGPGPRSARGRLWLDMAAVTAQLIGASPFAAAALAVVLVVGNSAVALMAAAMGGFVGAAVRDGRAGGAAAGAGHGMAFWLGVYAAAALTEQFYWNFKNLSVQYMRDHGLHRMQGRILRRAAAAPLLRFEEASFFDALQRASSDLGGRLNMLIYTAGDMVQLLVMTASVAVVLGLIDPWLVPLLVAGTLPAVWLQGRVSTAMVAVERAHTRDDRVRGHLQGLLTGREAAAELRLFGAAGYLLERWRRLRAARGRDVLAAETRTGAAATIGSAVSGAAYAAGLLLAAEAILHGRLSVGNYVTVAAAALGFEERLQAFIGLLRTSDEHAAFLADLLAFLRWMRAEDAPDGAGRAARTGFEAQGTARPGGAARSALAVSARGVGFSYPGSARPALRGVDVEIRAGERVAIVGENGAGKSTLAKVLIGLYPPGSGAVLLDGAPPAAARRRIAAVFQDFAAYDLTLRENVGFGDPSRLEDGAAIAAALARAGLGGLEARLEGGLDGFLGRAFGGTELSGGQWQRVALARAFFRDADLLVLDEPTAALDPLAELALFERFADLAAGRTAIMISHRLGAARLAHRILVLADGRIAEQGTHDALLANGGVYAGLFEAQAQWYR